MCVSVFVSFLILKTKNPGNPRVFNGSKEARTPDLSRVRRTLIPAELCFRIQIQKYEWSIWDSNPRPPQCECGALPTALMPRKQYYITDLEKIKHFFDFLENFHRRYFWEETRRAEFICLFYDFPAIGAVFSCLSQGIPIRRCHTSPGSKPVQLH